MTPPFAHLLTGASGGKPEDPAIDITKAWVEKTFKHPKLLTSCRISPSGRWAAAGGIDAQVHLWDLESDRKLSLEGHSGWVTALAFSADGTRLLSTDSQGGVRAWWVEDSGAVPLWTRKEAHAGWIRAAAASRDGRFFATAGHDRVVRLWSAGDGAKVRELPGHAGEIYSLEFHPDGRSLVSGDLFGKVRHWDLESGKLVREIDASVLHTRGEDFLADVGGVRSMAFDAKGETLACGGLSDAKSNTFCPGAPTVLFYDWATGAQKLKFKAKEDKIDGAVTSLRYLPDGTLAGTAEGQSMGAVWFWKDGESDPFHTISSQSVYGVDLHPDGRRIAATGFETVGRGGNGRHVQRGGYLGNGGQLRLISLLPKPAPAKKK